MSLYLEVILLYSRIKLYNPENLEGLQAISWACCCHGQCHYEWPLQAEDCSGYSALRILCKAAGGGTAAAPAGLETGSMRAALK